MSKIKKVYVGGSVMSGKNVLWRLLDGHINIVSNVQHNNIGSFILDKNCKESFIKNRPGLYYKTLEFVPTLKIAYKTGETASVPIGNFYHALYNYSGYKSFYSWASGNSMFVAPKEGVFRRLPFIFDIHLFEKTLKKELFSVAKIFSEEEIIDVIYYSYIHSLGDKYFRETLMEKKNIFVDTLANGINQPRLVSENLAGAKILLMKRNLESLLYANAARMMSYQDQVREDATFNLILFNQKEFERKMKLFHKEASDLQAKNSNVMLVDFNNLILNTENTMKELANFIGIQYEPILALPSVNGKIIDEYQLIGKIGDDPYANLSKKEIDLLKYYIYGFDEHYSILKNITIFLQAIKWRWLTNLVRKIAILLKIILPEEIFLQMKKIYKRMS